MRDDDGSNSNANWFGSTSGGASSTRVSPVVSPIVEGVSLNSAVSKLDCISIGDLKVDPAGRIASCASCTFFNLFLLH